MGRFDGAKPRQSGTHVGLNNAQMPRQNPRDLGCNRVAKMFFQGHCQLLRYGIRIIGQQGIQGVMNGPGCWGPSEGLEQQ